MQTGQHGFLLESLGLVLLILSMVALMQMNQKFEDALDEDAVRRGKAIAAVGNMAHAYLVTYSSELLALADLHDELVLTTGAGDHVRVVQGGYPELEELRQLGLTPHAMKPNAPGGGRYVIQIEKTLPGCTGSGCNLDGLVSVDQPYQTNGAVDYARLGLAVGAIGPDGAYSKRNSPQTLSGFGGAWSVSNPVLAGRGQQSGILAARFGYTSSELSVFYKRDGSTPLTGDMNANDHHINNVLTLNAKGKIAGKNFITPFYPEGESCEPGDENAFASGTTGSVMVCQGGQWKYAKNNPVTQGASCSPDGSTGTAANGETLMCKGNLYVRLNNLIAKNVQVGRVVVVDDMQVEIPKCEPGGVPDNSILIDYAALDVTQLAPKEAMDVAAMQVGSNWLVSLKLIDIHGLWYSGNDYSLRAVMNLECRYQ